jgi:glucose/arabinose dehydrogenase/subtilisin-like proprotein convertase family protein
MIGRESGLIKPKTLSWRGLSSRLPALLAIAAVVSMTSSLCFGESFTDSNFASELVTTLPAFTPVGLGWAPDGRVFIWQKNGVVRILKNGALISTPFLDFSSKVNLYQDNGMWGFTFDPNFAANRFIYLTYVYEPNGNPNDTSSKTARLVRVTADPGNPDVMLAGSEVILMTCPDDFGTHALGSIRFANDGKMFVGNGDGASPFSPDANAYGAQDLNNVRGKIFRLNSDGSAPSDNPFYDGTQSTKSKVWCYGVRNPYRFSLHPTTGEPYFADVGWNLWEEIDRGVRGGNFGWPCYEGNALQPDYGGNSQCAAPGQLNFPIVTYSHSAGDLNGGGTCIVGGDFYRGSIYPTAYQGNYFYADYSGNWIHRIVLGANGLPVSTAVFATGISAPTFVEQGPDGLLYYVSFTTGEIRRIRYNGLIAVASANPTYGYSPLSISFSSAGTSNPGGGSLNYNWNFGDGTSSTAANPSHTYVASGISKFTATLTISSGGSSSSSTVAITVGSVPPTPSIQSPPDGTGYMPGQVVSYQGSAIDAEDGSLPATALQWTVLLHHNTHVHTVAVNTGSQGSFVVENHGSIGTFSYEILLTATDSSGLQSTSSISIPVIADTTAPSAPAGLSASASSSSEIDLSWQAATDNAAVASYSIERCQGVGCGSFMQVATVTGTAYADTGLFPQTPYTYRVQAFDASGNASNFSSLASATTLNGPSTQTATFSSVNSITIPDSGAATPYPSTINVSGMGGTISSVTVALRSLTHTWGNDIDAILVGPVGQKMTVMSDAGTGAFNNVNLTFADSATASLPQNGSLSTGTFKPTDYPPTTSYPSPAPGGPYGTTLSTFNGTAPNGAWSLYVFDDGPGDQGSIGGGWSLTITTASSGPSAPTISDIADQVTTIGTATAAIPFTVNDTDTPVASLVLTGTSSNVGLVPNANMVFGGSGNNRTVTVTPAAGQTGTATITVTVSDGALTASDTLLLTVNAVNTAPTISDILDQTINEDSATTALGFTVGDGQTAAGSLTVSGSSSNPTLVPNANIVFGGSGANRTLTATPAANQSGSATITVTVSDGALTASDTFVLTVNPVNDPPTISTVANQSISPGGSTGPLALTVGDVETAAGNLTVTGSSSNPTLVPNGNIVFGGSGSARTVTVTGVAGQTGSATITLTVSDGALTESTSFSVTASSGTLGTASFTNTGSITIPSAGAATPYPSTINVSGMGGTISSVTVALRTMSHTWGDDIDVLLVGPAGQKMTVMSDAGTGGFNNINLTFVDSATGSLPQTGSLKTGTYKPTDYPPTTSYPSPAPAGPYGTTLSTFNGTTPNGAWSLYVFDDGPGDQGRIAGGWSLTITTTSGGLSATALKEGPLFLSVERTEEGLLLRLNGVAGKAYTIESSDDVDHWEILTTVNDQAGINEVKDNPKKTRFYRASQVQ